MQIQLFSFLALQLFCINKKYKANEWIDDLEFYGLLNSILVISCQWRNRQNVEEDEITKRLDKKGDLV